WLRWWLIIKLNLRDKPGLRSIQLKGLLKKLLQVRQDCNLVDHQARSRITGRLLERGVLFVRESDHRHMAGGMVLFELDDRVSDIAARGQQVGHDQHRLLLL